MELLAAKSLFTICKRKMCCMSFVIMHSRVALKVLQMGCGGSHQVDVEILIETAITEMRVLGSVRNRYSIQNNKLFIRKI